jgi:site-specific recombinase XerD
VLLLRAWTRPRPTPCSAPSSGTCAENRSAQTVATYLIALRQAEAFLTGSRGTTLAAAGRADLEAYLGDLLTRRAPATAATSYKVLKLLYQWLEDEDELPTSPMAKMRPPIIPDQPDR